MLKSLIRTKPTRGSGLVTHAGYGRTRGSAWGYNNSWLAALRRRASTHTHGEQQLTWNRYLSLRKVRRRYGILVSVILSLACSGLGSMIILSRDLENIVAQHFSVDPFVAMASMIMGITALGWLLGPSLGSLMFRFRYYRVMGEILKKEREFYHRIRKHRVDPSSSSVQNPVPDYYGEKIGSLADYRQWLKDQRAFMFKRGKLGGEGGG